MISRNRERLSRGFRFVIPENDLTETLVDKLRFQRLAEQLQLPVPNAKLLIEDVDYSFGEGDLNFPIVIKPLTRKKDEWSPLAGLAKALRIDGPLELDEFKRAHPFCGGTLLAQEMIPGTESSIESYHVYVDSNGDIVGEFTGKKIRTFPKEFGQSCALTISAADDVLETGREIVSKLSFRGVAKLDFKRDSDGKLFLLEINPRFNLWHHLGAAAGINLPHLVYCDLTGVQRPNFGVAKVGANWCRLWQDLFSARAEGVPFVKWLFWAIRCQAKPGISWDDPMPLLGAAMSRVQHRLVQYAFRQKNA